jgi:hypothetical protein
MGDERSSHRDDAGEVRWMTYAEAAAALGVDPDSVARRARRQGWERMPGNDGTMRIAVPLSVLDGIPAEGEGLGRASSLGALAAELVRIGEAMRVAVARERAAADALAALRAEMGRAAAELERLRAAASAEVRYHAAHALPPGYRVLRSRLDGLYRWQRPADGATGEGAENRWSARRRAWATHRRDMDAREGGADAGRGGSGDGGGAGGLPRDGAGGPGQGDHRDGGAAGGGAGAAGAAA